MSDLMELVNDCSMAQEFITKTAAVETINLLRDLGFNTMSMKLHREAAQKNQLKRIGEEKYIKITDANIVKFLERKVKAYNKAEKMMTEVQLEATRGLGDSLSSSWTQEYAAALGRSIFQSNDPMPPSDSLYIYRNTIHSQASSGIGKFVWQETKINEYAGIPPKQVLDKLQETQEKKIFDYFTIATVNEVKDPLLLGRLSNHADRYFLAQWGNDVSLDEVI